MSTQCIVGNTSITDDITIAKSQNSVREKSDQRMSSGDKSGHQNQAAPTRLPRQSGQPQQREWNQSEK